MLFDLAPGAGHRADPLAGRRGSVIVTKRHPPGRANGIRPPAQPKPVFIRDLPPLVEMTKVALNLVWATPPEWAAFILDNFDDFLVDHANCERKASALAMSFVVKYPNRTEMLEPLIALAQEELEHFRQVYALMAQRGLQIAADERDPYVNAMLKLCRHTPPERFIDRMLTASIVECRGAERFRLIHEALSDPTLKAFYRDLWAAEAKHGNLFAALLLPYFDSSVIMSRLAELTELEAEIIQDLPWRHSLH